MNIQGKCVLITGAAKRCGAALARAFADAGASLRLHCNTSLPECAALAAGLPGSGHRVIQADFTDPEAVGRLALEASKCDIIINNASLFFRPGSTEDLAGTALYRQVNFLAPEQLINAWLKSERTDGCVVNILDQAVLNPGSGGYWQSRHDLLELTQSLARTLGKRNLRFNAVAPGPMLPPYWAPDSQMAKTLPQLPLGRPVALEDFTAAVLLLCRCESITGAILPVDCGQHLK